MAGAGLSSWRIKSNNSIVCNPNLPSCYRVELVSPPLSGTAGLQQIYKIAKAVKPLNPSVNKSCGLHVHVKPAQGSWALQQLKTLSYNWCQLESAMDLLLPNSRRYSNNNYCKSNIAVLRQNGAAAGQHRKKFEALKDITRAVSIAGLTDLVCPTDRYYKLNLRALERHGTVEFRAAGGTSNATKVVGYVLLFLNLADASCRGSTAPPSKHKEYVFENIVKFLAKHTGCMVLLHWLPRRKLELNNRRRSSSSRAGGGSSSAGAGPVNVTGGGRNMRAHATSGSCGCAECRQRTGSQR
ncbi:hypothetical protein OEZ85_012907 [Tetradesmus obliquus]|uniref:Amidoligase enzyme n=1 Tax=Tetradesmus obliquus TaxID=3088 RepID=A0ABY8U414_TETOB|nr:hypothetical protein OEZ85_012907 [Tetradesmus obliquus]